MRRPYFFTARHYQQGEIRRTGFANVDTAMQAARKYVAENESALVPNYIPEAVLSSESYCGSVWRDRGTNRFAYVWESPS